MLSFAESSETRAPYEGIIIIEPPMLDRKLLEDNYNERMGAIAMISKMVSLQQGQFASRAAAYEILRTAKRGPWKRWDDRSCRILVVCTHQHTFVIAPQTALFRTKAFAL